MIEIYSYLKERANTTEIWLSSDTPENYKDINKFGPNLYKPGDFLYKFNKQGFRSDDFDLNSELPVVFVGCSSTEGIGLPIEDVWCYKLLTKIRLSTKKDIPFWNLGLAGESIDTVSRNLYWFTRFKKVKFIFSYFPESNRREFKHKNSNLSKWSIWAKETNSINELFLDEHFISHQVERSLMIIDSVRESNNSIMYSSSWAKQGTIMYSFPNINFFNTRNIIPYIDIARDNIHHGPKYHSDLADAFWKKCRHHFE